MTAPISERDAVLRERAAFEEGVLTARKYERDGGAWPGSIALALARYPLPKITQPRVVTDCVQVQWRVLGSAVQWCARNGGAWNDVEARGWGNMYLTVERVTLIADLLANPLEEVEAES